MTDENSDQLDESTTDDESAPEQASSPSSADGLAFDIGASGLRKHGDEAGSASLTAAVGDVVEAYWSVQKADLVQLVRDGENVGESNRASDGSCPVPIGGLAAGTYNLKLLPGVATDDEPVWSEDAALALSLTLLPALAITEFWGEPEPADGKNHPPRDLQLEEGTKVTLRFEAVGAKQVKVSATPDGGDGTDLDPVDLCEDGTGSLVVDPGGTETIYTAVAVNGDAQSDQAGPVTVSFHATDEVVSPIATVSGQPSAELVILAADGSAGLSGTKLCLGAGDGLRLEWTVAGAKSAKLTGKSLVQKSCGGADAPDSAGHVSNDRLVSSGVDLPLDEHASGSGVVVVDPGPCGSAEYTLTLVLQDDSAGAPSARATAYVANFNVQLKLPDGSDYARNKSCVLEIPDQEPVTGTTNESGELWLWLPNDDVDGATLRLLDGDDELGRWELEIEADDGVPIGTLALNDAAEPDPGDDSAVA